LFVQIGSDLLAEGLLEMIVSSMHDSEYDVDVCSSALPLLAKVLYGISLSSDTKGLSRFIAIRGCETLVAALTKNSKRCDVFYWTCKAVIFMTQGPFNHSSGATARLISEGFCDILMKCWQKLTQLVNCKCGNADHGEEYSDDPALKSSEIVSALCFFTGCETVVALCCNSSSNSTLNSTHNKLNVRLNEERKGNINVYSRYGIKDVSSVGAKAVQVLETKASIFLSNLFFQRVRSMLVTMESLRVEGVKAAAAATAFSTTQNNNTETNKNNNSFTFHKPLSGSQAFAQGPSPESMDTSAVVVSMALTLQATQILTNNDGKVPYNGKIPSPRRIQNIALLTAEHNEANLSRCFQIFRIDFGKWMEEN